MIAVMAQEGAAFVELSAINRFFFLAGNNNNNLQIVSAVGTVVISATQRPTTAHRKPPRVTESQTIDLFIYSSS
jgi:hypothetical protein